MAQSNIEGIKVSGGDGMLGDDFYDAYPELAPKDLPAGSADVDVEKLLNKVEETTGQGQSAKGWRSLLGF